ncbi:MAG: hypothetical protein ACPF9D_04270 [Owenweeksia sp.]
MIKSGVFKIVWVVCLFCLQSGYAQQKFEKESRLKVEDVPARALQFIDSLGAESKIHWYFEEGLESTSIEAKFRYKGKKLSVEFDTSGKVEDVEIQVKWSALASALRDSIRAVLRSDCTRFSIRKVQVQYSGSRNNLISKLRMDSTTAGYVTRYELVTKCRTDEDIALYEYLFDSEGLSLTRSKIIFNNSSNLEY